MTDISDYWLYLDVETDGALYSDIRDSRIDLHILEAGNTSRTAGVEPSLDTVELQALLQAGQTVIGYVNVAVPDFNRSYWQDGWVTPAPQDPDDLDYGTIADDAPAWLQGNLGVATGPEEDGDGIYSYIVDYADADWQQIVVDQAVTLVSAGYGGVFLDDVGRYFAAGGGDTATPQDMAPFARSMIDLVNTVSRAVEAVNPDAYVAINGGAYLRFDADPAGGAYAGFAEFTGHVDALLLENQYRDASSVWQDAASSFASTRNPDGIDFLALEWSEALTPAQEADFAGAYAQVNNVLTLITPTSAYDTAPPAMSDAVVPETAAAMYRLYEAVFERAPDPAGFHFWSGVLDSPEFDLTDAAAQFVTSAEFDQTYGALDDAAFLDEIYRNVLDRAPDDAGYAFWLNALDTGATRAELTVGFSQSAEFEALTSDAFLEWFDIWG